MNKTIKKTIMSALMATLAFIAFSVNANAATFVVNTTADTQDATAGNGICADSGGACSLRAAISEANAFPGPDIITLPAGTYTQTLVAASENLNAGGDFDITSAITINGAGSGTTIIQANAAPMTATERVIHCVTAATAVVIKSVTIQNGNYNNNTFGGGIRLETATTNLTLTLVYVRNNRSAGSGGGIHIATAGITLNIDRSIIGDNSAGSSVGATTGNGAGINVASTSTVNITDSRIENNRNNSAVATTFGGGINVTGAGSVVTISGSTITNNSSTSTLATGAGLAGGIYNQGATVNINNSIVNNNTASSFHAGIRTLASTVAAATNITNSTVAGNSAPGEGGGVINISGGAANSITTITGSTISANTAPGAGSVGGGIENLSIADGLATVNLTNSTVSGNSADSGGGIYNDGATATINLNYSTVAANTAMTNGGGLRQDTTAGGLTNLRNSIAADNNAATGPDIFGTITSLNYNHIENTSGGTFVALGNDVTGSDPQLGVLGNSGGNTDTHLPATTSPVIDTIPPGTSGCGTTVTTDQRGFTRPSGTGCDKGSVEVGGMATPIVSGRVTYANAATTTGVPFTTITAVGSIPLSTMTDSNGNYSLTGFGSGAYTITPSKANQVNGISNLDASRIAQHLVGLTTLTANQLIAADTSGNGSVSSLDAAYIAQFVASIANPSITGTWKFIPTNRSYPNVMTNQTNQDYSAILVGEVTGNWNPAGPLRSVLSAAESEQTRPDEKTAKEVVAVTVSANEAEAEKAAMTFNLTAAETTGAGILGYQFDVLYDATVIEPQANGCDVSETLSSGMTAICRVSESGVLKVVVFGAKPVSGTGTLLRLKFNVVGKKYSASAMSIGNFMFNEDSPQEVMTDGQVLVGDSTTEVNSMVNFVIIEREAAKEKKE